MFVYETRDVVIVEDAIHLVAVPVCSFNVSWRLVIYIRAANEIRFVKN